MPELLEAMPHWQGGGSMIDKVSFQRTTYAAPPGRFEAGTPHIVGALGLHAAIDYVESIGLSRIHAHETALVTQARAALETELHNGRDRLLELNSSGAGAGEQLVEDILEQDDQFALPMYMEELFNAFGIDSEDHSDNALILKPSEKMLDAGFPLGDDEGVTITYDRNMALVL